MVWYVLFTSLALVLFSSIAVSYGIMRRLLLFSGATNVALNNHDWPSIIQAVSIGSRKKGKKSIVPRRLKLKASINAAKGSTPLVEKIVELGKGVVVDVKNLDRKFPIKAFARSIPPLPVSNRFEALIDLIPTVSSNAMVSLSSLAVTTSAIGFDYKSLKRFKRSKMSNGVSKQQVSNNGKLQPFVSDLEPSGMLSCSNRALMVPSRSCLLL